MRPTLADAVQLLIDILQGAGLSGAAGIRPFLPALVAGGFAIADVGVDYEGTPFAFLEQPWWMLAIIVALLATIILQRKGAFEAQLDAALQGLAIGIGAVLFAGTLADNEDVWWPGLLAGGLCAALAIAATRSLVARVRARLDSEARGALPVYLDGSSALFAGATVLLAPLAVAELFFFAFLLRGGRRREGEKYAGLRILR